MGEDEIEGLFVDIPLLDDVWEGILERSLTTEPTLDDSLVPEAGPDEVIDVDSDEVEGDVDTLDQDDENDVDLSDPGVDDLVVDSGQDTDDTAAADYVDDVVDDPGLCDG